MYLRLISRILASLRDVRNFYSLESWYWFPWTVSWMSTPFQKQWDNHHIYYPMNLNNPQCRITISSVTLVYDPWPVKLSTPNENLCTSPKNLYKKLYLYVLFLGYDHNVKNLFRFQAVSAGSETIWNRGLCAHCKQHWFSGRSPRVSICCQTSRSVFWW